MTGVGIIVTILIFFIAVLLGIIVLIQNPKGGGLGSAFGSANQLGGVKRTADFLEKATWGLAIALVVLCLWSSSIVSSQRGVAVEEDFAGEAEATFQGIPGAQEAAGSDFEEFDPQEEGETP